MNFIIHGQIHMNRSIIATGSNEPIGGKKTMLVDRKKLKLAMARACDERISGNSTKNLAKDSLI